MEKGNKQLKISLTFRNTEYELELHDYIIEQGKKEIGGASGFIKRLVADYRSKRT